MYGYLHGYWIIIKAMAQMKALNEKWRPEDNMTEFPLM